MRIRLLALLVLAILASASPSAACFRDGAWIFLGEWDSREQEIHRSCPDPAGPSHFIGITCKNPCHPDFLGYGECPDYLRSHDYGPDYDRQQPRRGQHRHGHRGHSNIHLTTGQVAIVEGAQVLRDIIRPRRQQPQVVIIREEQRPEPEVNEETGGDCKTLVNTTNQKVKVVIDGELIELLPREKRNKCSSEVTDVDASVRVGTRVELHLRYEDKPIDFHLEEADPTDRKHPYERIVFAEVKR